MCAGIPRKSSSYSSEGTAAHKLAEMCLLENKDARAFVGTIIETESDGSWEVTREMAEAVQFYLDEVRRVKGLLGGEVHVEVRVDLTDVVPDMFGTCDACVIEEEF